MRYSKPKITSTHKSFYDSYTGDWFYLCRDFEWHVINDLKIVECSDLIPCAQCPFSSKYAEGLETYFIEDTIDKLGL